MGGGGPRLLALTHDSGGGGWLHCLDGEGNSLTSLHVGAASMGSRFSRAVSVAAPASLGGRFALTGGLGFGTARACRAFRLVYTNSKPTPATTMRSTRRR